ncbi:PefC/AfrB family outer membrane usher protein [Escherichia albertii]|uniref:PefC/AfrB family outer membrane usher protein n=1 Tax=Escherichia albertii TaxID=208962 RepID=UPI0011313967|nr:PefC/AfrB family outer membrane usher protein [Escherichia albertii]
MKFHNNIILFIVLGTPYSASSYASEFNLDFIQGASTIPSILKDNSELPIGKYYVDVFLNGKKTKRAYLDIDSDENKENALCLSEEWLKNAGIFLSKEIYDNTFIPNKGCYILSKKKFTNVTFDFNSQSLLFNIPQIYLEKDNEQGEWDYGINGSRVNYYANFNKTTNNKFNAFGNVSLYWNMLGWILSSNINLERLKGSNDVTSSELTISRAIRKIKGDLLIGKSQTVSSIFSDFNFYGIAVRSNANMTPWRMRGYAPDISGIVTTPSRITVKQNGHVIYSKVLPAGPYSLDDLRPVGNGDLLVTVEDDKGNKNEKIYPVSTLPTLLRSGEYKYNFAIGKKNTEKKIEKAFSSDDEKFFMASIDYGLKNTTLNFASLFSDAYQAVGVGTTHTLGDFGVFSLSASTSRAKYNNGDRNNGHSFSIKYAKNILNNTDIQLLTYRYQTEGYTEFTNFSRRKKAYNSNVKSRYEAKVSHKLYNGFMSGSLWKQNYWNQEKSDLGASLSLSTTVNNRVSLNLNGSYTKSSFFDKPDYAISFGISIPFDLRGEQYYSSNNVGYDNVNGTTFDTTVSTTVNNRFNYSISAGGDSKGTSSLTASGGYTFDSMQTNFSVSSTKMRQGVKNNSFSGSLSGSALYTTKTGVLLTKESADTIGIVHVPDMKGITFNSSLPTDSNGNAVVWLSEYNKNNININMDNVPDDVELENTSFEVVPTEKSITYREFKFNKVYRYILHVKDKSGVYLTGGDSTTELGISAGTVSSNGVLLVNTLKKPVSININREDGKTCKIPLESITPNSNNVNEVTCE